MLHGNKVVLQPFGLVFSFSEQPVQPACDVNLVRGAGGRGNLRQPVEFLFEAPVNLVRRYIGFEKQRCSQALLLFDKSREKVLDVDLLVAKPDRFRLGGLKGLLAFSVRRLKSMVRTFVSERRLSY